MQSDKQIELFYKKVKKLDSGCWEWVGAKINNGYGKLKRNSKWWLAHRYSFFIFNGFLTEGLTIDHTCRNRKCVNPHHLEEVSMRENLLRSPYTLTSICKNKSECPKGHPYSGTNLIVELDGSRKCRKCRSLRDKIRRPRKVFSRPLDVE